MSQEMQSPKPRDGDGPATAFEADPKVNDIFVCQDGDHFGLVLIAGWPPDPAIHTPYQTFLDLVRECFDKEDLSNEPSGESSSSPLPRVYLYPSVHIHVTVATFAPSEKRGSDKDISMNHSEFQNLYLSLVQEASQLPEWPTQPIQLVVRSTQLGSKAGILLWDDISGGIAKIRGCIRQTAARRNLDVFGIPGIIHSTFLRFSQVPQTQGGVAQDRFQSKVIPQVSRIFQEPLTAPAVKLVIESTPYMHIPDDDQHVLHTWQLDDSNL